MKPPKRILLYQPWPDTADFEWCDTKDQLNIDNINSHMYVRADFVFEVLEDHKKVQALIVELGKDNPVYEPGQPCDHPGCLSHQSHPCEGCGRIGGR